MTNTATPTTPGLRRRRSDMAKTPEQIAVQQASIAKAAQKTAFIRSLQEKGGRLWIGDKAERVYFEKPLNEFKSENPKIGYVDLDTGEFVSTRMDMSNEDFKNSLGM